MKFVVAGYGSRGDVEPCAAAALELLRRGHDVRMAVPPNMLRFIESAGLIAVRLRPGLAGAEPARRGFRPQLTPKNPLSVMPEPIEYVAQV